MNLRLFVFLALGVLSSAASADWFDGYQSKTSNEVFQPAAEKVEMNHQAAVTQSYPDTSHFLVKHHFSPKTLAPSFDVVAREMEQMRNDQVSQEYALITYLQKIKR